MTMALAISILCHILWSDTGRSSLRHEECTPGSQSPPGRAWLLEQRADIIIFHIYHRIAPKACMSSWTRLSTAILRGILDCCCDFMLMKRQLKLYVFPSTLYLQN